MKKLLKRVFGITVSAMLFATTAMPAFAADGHSHHGEDTKLEVEEGYTVTMTLPSNYEVNDGIEPAFGAYQIFTGTVKDETYTDPGSSVGKDGSMISLIDIRWGNAFGDANDVKKPDGGGKSGKEMWQDNIVGFVVALATTPEKESTTDYKAAFATFEGFETFVNETDKTKLADRFYYDTNGTAGIQDSEKTNGNVNFNILATEVAKVISGHNDRIWLQAFTDILGGYGEGYENGNYVEQFYGGAYTAKADGTPEKYEIKVPAGYYMILDQTGIDEKAGGKDESYSARMLFVANDVTQKIKQDVPTLDKKILRADGEHDTEAADVGDEVQFRLIGTLPNNYDQYTLGYQFTFTDTLSKGLTLKNWEKPAEYTGTPTDYTDESLKISVKGVYNGTTWDSEKVLPISKEDITSTTHTHATSVAYTAQVTETDGIQTLTVNFPCLKEIAIKEGDATYTLGGDNTNKSEIRIDYTAVVDSDAVVSPATKGVDETTVNLNGNKNTAKLTYSDNPQSYGDTDDTTEEHATVYTFGLDITKVDATEYLKTGSATGTAVLEGAKFAVVRPDADTLDTEGKTKKDTTWEIAKFQLIDKDTAMKAETQLPIRFYYGYYSIVKWESIKKDETEVTGATFDEKWLENYTDEDDATEVYNITSLSDGVLNISGLDSDITYTIAETATPSADYAKINPFTVTLTANQNAGTKEYDGKLSGATSDQNIEAGKSFSFDRPVDITDTFDGGAESDGSANMLVANFKYVDLPSTGGVGTYWFYILGAGGLAISFVLFRLSRKKIVQ